MNDALVSLTREPIDTPALRRAFPRDDAGGVVVFEGVVRAERLADGRRLVALDYEAYEEMALEQMGDLRRRALASFDVLDAAVVHRLGRIPLGQPSVVIVVAAAHRAAAFDACRFIIDVLKTDVPIWKKEVWHDGSTTWSDPLA